MLDYLFVNGKYPDYEKNEFIEANVGIKDGKITFIGPEKPETKEVIDCTGKIVSPGFIDIHMHEEKFSEGLHWGIAEYMAKMGVTLAVGGNCGDLFQTVKEFKSCMNELGGCPTNYMMFSGYNYYRNHVLGIGHYEPTTKEQRDKIREYIREDIKEGACGISFGIEYDPGMTEEEIIYGTEASDDSHLLIAAHYRADGDNSVAAVKEMIDIQSKINKKFQISHLSSCSAMGTMGECIRLINEAIEKDPRLNYDTYPYNAFSTTLGSTVFEDGCIEAWGKEYSDIMLTLPPYENVRCTREIFVDARERFPGMYAIAFVMNEDEIADAIINKHGMVASDGVINMGLGHPRAAGTFPRVLGKYVREEKKLSLIDALRKMTLEPAKRLEIEDRMGLIKEGFEANITVFDPETIMDGPDFGKIGIPNKGIEYVFVNGQMAVKGTELLNKKAGKFIAKRH